MNQDFLNSLQTKLNDVKEAGLFKAERIIVSQQQADITLADGAHVLNFCANNYLGLANNQELIDTAADAVQKYGYGMSSVRFICGTQDIHKKLEKTISDFLKTEDTILYSSCFDANGGLFETLLEAEDAIISDALNHASIIDGVRLSKAKRYRYANNDMSELEKCLQQADADGARYKLIATDGVFSMDGVIANLKAICDLADKYNAIVMVDDSHAVGFVGENGRGTPEYCGVEGRVDIITGTLGKALGGAMGGYTSGKKQVIDWLRQRSRPYLFSNTLAPVIAATSVKVFELLKNGDALRQKLKENSAYFRSEMEKRGFKLAGYGHAIIPVMVGDAKLAGKLAEKMLEKGIYVIAFSYPVVPQGQARIRTQMSSAHSKADIDKLVNAFEIISKEIGVI